MVFPAGLAFAQAGDFHLNEVSLSGRGREEKTEEGRCKERLLTFSMSENLQCSINNRESPFLLFDDFNAEETGFYCVPLILN